MDVYTEDCYYKFNWYACNKNETYGLCYKKKHFFECICANENEYNSYMNEFKTKK